MEKRLIVHIGYNYYLCDSRDAVTLLEIAARAQRVRYKKWKGPYYIDPDQEPFASKVELADFKTDRMEDIGPDATDGAVEAAT